MPSLFGAPLEFYAFAAILAGVAFAHRRAMLIALVGLAVLVAYKLAFSSFADGAGLAGLTAHIRHEWVVLADILLLLLGFSLLSNQFEMSRVPDLMPRLLPDNWTGGLALLAMIFVMSAFLDNIAAAVIGGVVARHVYRGQVSIGYIAAIVASANAGGAGSVIGDTTTTLMWISGVSPLVVLPAFIGALAAFATFAVIAARQQSRFGVIIPHAPEGLAVDWVRAAVVAVVIVAMATTNAVSSALAPQLHHQLPVLGLAIWAAIAATALVRQPEWSALRGAAKGAVFLAALVASASLMPVQSLPPASPLSAFALGLLSSVFDNIPLTALALQQGGYDWSLLAYAVGFGGSMLWFGSSAGVAITNLYPEARSSVAWVRQAWFIPVAYVVGFVVLWGLFGWAPTPLAGR